MVAAELETERLRLSLSATPVRTWQQQGRRPRRSSKRRIQQQATQAQQQGTTPASQQATPAAAPPRLTETMSTPQTTPGAPLQLVVSGCSGCGGMVPNDEQDTVSPAEESPPPWLPPSPIAAARLRRQAV